MRRGWLIFELKTIGDLIRDAPLFYENDMVPIIGSVPNGMKISVNVL